MCFCFTAHNMGHVISILILFKPSASIDTRLWNRLWACFHGNTLARLPWQIDWTYMWCVRRPVRMALESLKMGWKDCSWSDFVMMHLEMCDLNDIFIGTSIVFLRMIVLGSWTSTMRSFGKNSQLKVVIEGNMNFELWVTVLDKFTCSISNDRFFSSFW